MIDPIDTSTTAAAASTPKLSNDGMGKEEFLRLLTAQLSHQDPLNPMDGQQFAAQLAQFTSVEQLVNINGALDGQQEMYGLLSQNINSGVASGLIGRHVEADTNRVSWGGEGTVDLGFRLPDGAADVTLTVRDADGTAVRTLDLDAHPAGDHTAAWDGRDDHGAAVAPGPYTFTIDARDGGDGALEASPFVSGRVDRVSFGEEGIQLWLGETRLAMGAVRSVSE